jgi:hypothetical protein
MSHNPMGLHDLLRESFNFFVIDQIYTSIQEKKNIIISTSVFVTAFLPYRGIDAYEMEEIT